MGQHNRSDQGLLFGGGRGNYGWDWADEGDLKNARQVVSPKTASIVWRIYIWYVKYSLSYREIAKRLNARGIPAPGGGLWLHCAVARILRNPRYKGEAYNRRVKWEYVSGKKISKPHPDLGWRWRCPGHRVGGVVGSSTGAEEGCPVRVQAAEQTPERGAVASRVCVLRVLRGRDDGNAPLPKQRGEGRSWNWV